MTIDFNTYADAYQRNRSVQPKVLQALIEGSGLTPSDAVLEIGCGTANYLAAIVTETGASGYGVDPAERMLAEAQSEPGRSGLDLRVGSAESLPFPDDGFRFAYSVDVIHHIGDRQAAARAAFRVLSPGGRLCIATDSHEDIRDRIPLSSHFPETVPFELTRYPTIETITAEFESAGFRDMSIQRAVFDYELTDAAPYRERAFSSLRLIPAEAHAAGLARLEEDLADGPIPARSLYTLIWAAKP